MRLNVREVAAGKWRGILVKLGFDSGILDGKHRPCPACGGTDRWRFDDKDGTGSFYCSQCGPGSGVDLVMRVKDWDFKTAAQEIEKAAGFVRPEQAKPTKSESDIRSSLRKVWMGTHPVSAGDPVHRYLAGRGLNTPTSGALRYHPSLFYRDGNGPVERYQAMVALVSGPHGDGVTLHRTYLQDGAKAKVATPKKLMTPIAGVSGAAVRLFQVAEHIGVAEGIETAISASQLFGVPVWSVISAVGMEFFIPPREVKKVTIFADNDDSFVGQRAAFSLASKLRSSGIDADVQVPNDVGDWNDVLQGGQYGR